MLRAVTAAGPGRNCTSPGTHRGPWVSVAVAIVAVVLGWILPTAAARAAPGQGLRLGGAEPQGPASRALTALHHNPAMLAALQGSAIQVVGQGGIEQLRVRRNVIDPSTGTATSQLQDPTSLINPYLGFFVGGSLYFDPIAFGFGYYDLTGQYRLASADPLRYHLAPDPDPSCLDPGRGKCPPNGGAVSLWQDITLALALNRGIVHVGAAVHFPRVRERFAFDNDTELTPAPSGAGAIRCASKEDPLCAERVGFKGWNYWIPREGAPPGFDAALTLGVAVELRRDTITLGARYRTFPLRRAGEMALGGVALVCRPDPEAAASGDLVPPCEIADPIRATLLQRLPQQVAIGGSFVLGRARLWHVDTNLYWIDYCPGGVGPSQCPTAGAQRLRLVGLDRNSFVLPEFERFRGAQDMYGADVHAGYRIRSDKTILVGANVSSPSVRPSAQTAAWGEGWRMGLTAGGRFRIGQTNVLLTPGYGIDLLVPRRVQAQDAAFEPSDATAFAATGGDLNAPGASAVLAGRGRPTNAGRYFGMLHTFSLTLSWGESSRVFE